VWGVTDLAPTVRRCHRLLTQLRLVPSEADGGKGRHSPGEGVPFRAPKAKSKPLSELGCALVRGAVSGAPFS